MNLLLLVRPTRDVEAAAAAVASLARITLQEARMRLAPEPPTPLVLLEPAEAAAARDGLRRSGLAVIALPMPPPAEGARVVARTFNLGPETFSVSPRDGAPVSLAWSEVSTILRGSVATRLENESIQNKVVTKVGLGLAGNIKVKSEVVRSREVSVDEATEQAIYVFGQGGQRIALYEGSLEFSGLGDKKQVSRFQNTVLLAKLVKEHAPQAFYDERLLRLGRRPLPVFLRALSNRQATSPTTERSDTRVTLDILSEALRLAVAEGLLP